jgi:nucleotide-binding universal stress UspA family protein
MPGVILTVVKRPAVAARTLAAAQNLAELSDAGRINVLAIRMPPIETILPSEEILTREQDARIRSLEQERIDQLRGIFDAWAPDAKERGIIPEWCDIEERADLAVAEWGRRADFVVLKRPWTVDPEPERQAIHGALFDTDRPVLIVPPEPLPGPFGRRVAIAWRDDKRTVRAVLAALRWLPRAERIFVLAGARETGIAPGLPEILTEHGIHANLHLLSIPAQGVFGEALLANAHELGADMLVMGAYVHQPVVRLILGGVTRYMLTHADLPVLMRH